MEDDKILLREYRNSDVEAFLAGVKDDEGSLSEWCEWWKKDFSDRDAISWFDLCGKAKSAGSAYEFGIFCKATGRFLGGAGINQIDKVNRIANVGYWVRESCQRNGYALRALNLLIDYGLGVLNLSRLEIVILKDNIPSQKVAEKSIARRECLAENRLVKQGESQPAFIYSVVRR